MELDEELLNKIQIVSALDSKPLINGEFEYDDSSNTLYCGYYSNTWKGVTPLTARLRIEPFHTFNINVNANHAGSAYASLIISEFHTFLFDINIPTGGIVNSNLAFTEMQIKEFNVDIRYVGSCSVGLVFEKGE